MNKFQSIFDALRIRKDPLQKDFLGQFRVNRLSGAPVKENHYPTKTSLISERNLFAYWLMFAILDSDAERVREIIKNEFPATPPGLPAHPSGEPGNYYRNYRQIIKGDDRYFELTAINSQGFSIYIRIKHEHTFNATLIQIMTNNESFLAALDDLELKPVPPWHVFPETDDPIYLRCNQGSNEFWYLFLFLPFWESLNSKQRRQYLNDAPQKWAEFILDNTRPSRIDLFMPYWHSLNDEEKQKYLNNAPSGWPEFLQTHTIPASWDAFLIFWESLTDAQKQQYLDDAPEQWVDFIEDYIK
jgi:hypothetical protein